jgi:acyl dehydratase
VSAADLVVGRTWTGRPRTLTRTDFVRYAGISGDFNPMHHDEIRAQAAGEPSVFGHGMFSAGLLVTAVTELVGLAALRSYRVRFTRKVHPGDTVVPEMTATAVENRGGTLSVTLDCALRAGDRAVVTGTAVVEVSR